MPAVTNAARPPDPTTRSSATASRHTSFGLLALFLALVAVTACSDGGDDGTGPGDGGANLRETCDLELRFLDDGNVGRDGIPALTDPPTVRATSSTGLDFLRPRSRVLAFAVDGQAYAVPHNILWWHEIVNFNVGGEQLAVTYCPLTGSTLVFDRSSVGGTEFGVSGLLFKNNLVMFDRANEEGLWPQMLAEARCGDARGRDIDRWPAVEMFWGDWRERHPDGLVVSENTGFDRDYSPSGYPYGDYEVIDNPEFHFAHPDLDPRRPPKERLVGAPPTDSDPGIALPFGLLTDVEGTYAVVEFGYDGAQAVVLWSDDAQGGGVYRPRTTDGESVTLEATDSGIVDPETGSAWTIEGRAVSGDLEGEELVPVEKAYVAFWGAWAAFFPDTRLWSGP